MTAPTKAERERLRGLLGAAHVRSTLASHEVELLASLLASYAALSKAQWTEADNG